MSFPVLLTFSRPKRLGTYSKTDFSVDVAVEMPSEIFRSKVPVAVASGEVWAFAFRNWCYWYHRVGEVTIFGDSE